MLHMGEEIDYWDLLRSTQQDQYPDFVRNLSHQNGSLGEDGRAAMIEFRDGAKPSVTKFNTSDRLRRFFNEQTEPGATRRRLFILEGLPKSFVTVLGARLRIPPAFFSSHWVEPRSYLGTLINRTPKQYDNPNQFQLSFRKLHRAQIEPLGEDNSSTLYLMRSSVYRILSRSTMFGEADGPLTSFEQASFWGTRGRESWDG